MPSDSSLADDAAARPVQGPLQLARRRPLRWFIGAGWWIPGVANMVWSNVSDEWMLIHAVVLVWAVTSLSSRALAAWGTVTADVNGMSVRYRWITRRFGLQRRWDWSEVRAMHSEDRMALELHDGRTVRPIPRPLCSALRVDGWDKDLNAFVNEVQALARSSDGSHSVAVGGSGDPDDGLST